MEVEGSSPFNPVGNLVSLSSKSMSNNPDHYKPGGLPVEAVNILRLISDLEGSSQLLKYMGFSEDCVIIDEMKKGYYKLYFKLKREENQT